MLHRQCSRHAPSIGPSGPYAFRSMLLFPSVMVDKLPLALPVHKAEVRRATVQLRAQHHNVSTDSSPAPPAAATAELKSSSHFVPNITTGAQVEKSPAAHQTLAAQLSRSPRP
jgi:hypothetical protein